MANTLKFGNGEWYGKKDTILAYNDLNSNYKPLPFNFSRASSATVINKDGLIETVGSGQPRIDYKDDSKGALLLEPSRTNNITYSNNFLDSSWLPTGLTVSGGVISPDGTANAFTISNTAASGIIQKAVSLTGLRTVSIFAKKGTHRYLRLGAYGGTNSYANFDLENGVVSDGANAEIEDYGNGWYRCICHSADGTTGGVQIFPSNNSVGAATTNGSIQVYAAQLEQGSYATSYIPTQGSAVTRLADSCNQTVPDGVIGQTEGTLYLDFLSVNNFEGNSGILFQIKEDNNNRINIYFSNGTPRLFGIENSSGVFNQALSLTTGSVCKLAIKYNSTSTKVFINGSLSHTLNGINNIAFNDYSFLPNNNIDYNEIKLYNEALTDQELINLTTI